MKGKFALKTLSGVAALGLVLGLTSAYAGGPDHTKAFNGFYVGASAGYASATNNQQATGAGGSDFTYAEQNGGLFGAEFGFGKSIWSNFYMGVGASGSFLEAPRGTVTAPRGLLERRFDVDYTLNVFATPGWYFTPTVLGYLNLGMTYGSFNFSEINAAGGIVASQNPGDYGFLLGVGLKKAVTQHFSVFGEYDYYDYSRIGLRNTVVPAQTNRVANLDMSNVLVGVDFGFNA